MFLFFLITLFITEKKPECCSEYLEFRLHVVTTILNYLIDQYQPPHQWTGRASEDLDKQVCLRPDSLLQMQDTWRTNCRPLRVEQRQTPQRRKGCWDQERRGTTCSQLVCTARLTRTTQRPRLLSRLIPRLTCASSNWATRKGGSQREASLVLNKIQNKKSKNTLYKTEVHYPFNPCLDKGNDSRVGRSVI